MERKEQGKRVGKQNAEINICIGTSPSLSWLLHRTEIGGEKNGTRNQLEQKLNTITNGLDDSEMQLIILEQLKEVNKKKNETNLQKCIAKLH